MALTVYSSNRLENLADSLARELRERPQPPLTPEVVVVQSLGVRRWLSFALAERLGVAMHIEFPFPAHLVEQAFHALLPGSPVAPVFRRDVLPWRIHALLPELWNDPQFAGLRHYGSTDPLKLWQLAGQIAGVFDRYLAYRPQLLRAWDAGEDDPAHPWQSRLWRAAAARKPHPAALASRIATIPPSANSALPARINVFGLSTLPPFYLELLGELGRRTDVHMYLLSPSQEYWGDLRSEKEITRLRRWSERRGRTVPPTDEEVVHPLLASLGKIGREFHEAVLDLTPGREVTDFVEPTGAHLLAQVQRSILTLETPDEPMLLDPNDRSIQLHNCYSPLRELEVLHDQLLSLFANDPTLEPRDVLVSVPDISAYAPFVDAVFGAPESQKVQFPYSIADRDARAHNQVTDAFLRVLDLPGSRYTATQILSILDCPPVAAQFEIHPDELPLLRRWVAESGICWGRDDAHRERLGFPKWEENSWRFGLDRLLLGAAMPGGELCEGRLPHGDIEGALAQTLGKFATFCATVFRIADSFSAIVQSPEAWVETLREALAELCASDGDFADPWREAAQAIEAMGEQAKLAGSETPLTFPVVRGYLAHALAQTDRGNEFLRGGITFCSLKPMRAIPHRVVVLLGLNDGAFPRTARPPSFDLTASHPQPGDRTIRDDDRYLFLENILSARDVLYFSHCGQSAKDDSKSPPSVLLVEFLDYLSRAFRAPDGRSMQEHLTVSHPLQPFHRGYFDESAKHRLFSYSAEAAEAAKIAAMPRQEARPFVHRSDLTPATPREVSLDELSRFFVHPTAFFTKEILAMQLPREEASPVDVEPIALDSLEVYGLRQRLAEAALAHEDPCSLYPVKRAAGILPQGLTGEMFFTGAAREAEALAAAVDQQAPGAAVPERLVAVELGEWRLRGPITGQRGDLLVRVRAAKVAPKDLLRAWCAHLLACAAEPGARHRTLIIGKEGSETLRTVAEPEAELAKLLALFSEGHRRPLPFFPTTSFTYAEAKLPPKSKDPEEALRAARPKWNTESSFSRPEAADDWNKIVWGDADEVLNDEWEALALEIFRPLLAHLQEEEEG